MERIRRHSSLLIRTLISVAILAYLGSRLNLTQLLHIVQNASPLWIIPAVGGYGLVVLIGTARWQILLRAQGIHIPFITALRLFLIGAFFNAFLLGSTGGDVVKIYYAAQLAGKDRSAAGLTVILDRVIGLIALILLGVVLLSVEHDYLLGCLSTLSKHIVIPDRLPVILSAGALLLCAAGFVIWKFVIPRLAAWGQSVKVILQEIYAALLTGLHAWKSNLGAFGLSFILHSGTWITITASLQALHLGHVPILPFLSALPVIFILLALPISISGFGTRELLFVFFLGQFGVTEEHAIAFSLLYYSVCLPWSLLGGLIYLRFENKVKPE